MKVENFFVNADGDSSSEGVVSRDDDWISSEGFPTGKETLDGVGLTESLVDTKENGTGTKEDSTSTLTEALEDTEDTEMMSDVVGEKARTIEDMWNRHPEENTTSMELDSLGGNTPASNDPSNAHQVCMGFDNAAASPEAAPIYVGDGPNPQERLDAGPQQPPLECTNNVPHDIFGPKSSFGIPSVSIDPVVVDDGLGTGELEAVPLNVEIPVGAQKAFRRVEEPSDTKNIYELDETRRTTPEAVESKRKPKMVSSADVDSDISNKAGTSPAIARTESGHAKPDKKMSLTQERSEPLSNGSEGMRSATFTVGEENVELAPQVGERSRVRSQREPELADEQKESFRIHVPAHATPNKAIPDAGVRGIRSSNVGSENTRKLNVSAVSGHKKNGKQKKESFRIHVPAHARPNKAIPDAGIRGIRSSNIGSENTRKLNVSAVSGHKKSGNDDMQKKTTPIQVPPDNEANLVNPGVPCSPLAAVEIKEGHQNEGFADSLPSAQDHQEPGTYLTTCGFGVGVGSDGGESQELASVRIEKSIAHSEMDPGEDDCVEIVFEKFIQSDKPKSLSEKEKKFGEDVKTEVEASLEWNATNRTNFSRAVMNTTEVSHESILKVDDLPQPRQPTSDKMDRIHPSRDQTHRRDAPSRDEQREQPAGVRKDPLTADNRHIRTKRMTAFVQVGLRANRNQVRIRKNLPFSRQQPRLT